MQFIFPNRRRVGISHFVRQHVYQQIRLLRRLQFLFLADHIQEFARDQFIDDCRARRLRPDPVHVFELLLRLRIFDVLMYVLHALNQT